MTARDPRTNPLTVVEANALQFKVFAAVGAIARDRVSAPEIRGIAVAFDLLRIFGQKGLPAGDDFLRTFSTALGPFVYLSPALEDDPTELAATSTHEGHHVEQWHHGATKAERGDGTVWPSEIAFPVLFLRDPYALAKWESDAFAAGESVRFRLRGTRRTPEEVRDTLVANYRATPEAADLAVDILRSHWMTMDGVGLVAVSTATVAHAFLDTLGFPLRYPPA